MVNEALESVIRYARTKLMEEIAELDDKTEDLKIVGIWDTLLKEIDLGTEMLMIVMIHIVDIIRKARIQKQRATLTRSSQSSQQHYGSGRTDGTDDCRSSGGCRDQ